MARYNRFPVLIETVEDIAGGGRGLRYLRRELQPVANDFLYRVVKWLEHREYPLRGGDIDRAIGEREDENYGMTPTERLHPDSESLAEGMRVRLRKIRGVMSLRFIVENTAEHAPFFFSENEGGYEITPNGGKKTLRFWSGEPMPWEPPNVRMWPPEAGTFFPKMVIHPGHLNYAELVAELFADEGYNQRVQEAERRTFNRFGNDIEQAMG